MAAISSRQNPQNLHSRAEDSRRNNMSVPIPNMRSSTPACLVLMASFEGEQYIREQLESILSQRGVLVDIIIGDDASTDSTTTIARSLDKNGKISVIERAVRHGTAAQNFVQLIREADASQYDYVALSDQDDIWHADRLIRAIRAMSVAGAGGYSSSVTAWWPNGSEKILRQSARIRAADYLFEGAGQGCTFVLARELFEFVQHMFRSRPDLTTELIYHDWAIYALARARGFGWVFDPEPSLMYRQHATNETGARFTPAGISRRLRMIRDGRYRRQITAISRLCCEADPAQAMAKLWLGIERYPAFRRRISCALFASRHGRRRAMDRMGTALAALCGWI